MSKSSSPESYRDPTTTTKPHQIKFQTGKIREQTGLVNQFKTLNHLVEVKPTRQSANIKLPSSRVTHPTISSPGRISIFTPNRVRQKLKNLLSLWVAKRIASPHRKLEMLGVSRRTVNVVSLVREPLAVRTVDSGAVSKRVVRWTVVQSLGVAPKLCFRVYDHLRVTSDVGCYVTVAWLAVVFPAASDVEKVELTLGSSSLLDVYG